MHDRRPYASPLRAAQAEDTRDRILAATEALLARNDAPDISIDMIAAEAQVQKRTIFRHFESREVLFDAFWVWFNKRLQLTTEPATAEALIAGPLQAFPRFDAVEGVIRASLHTRSGRAMRTRATLARRAAFATALSPLIGHLLPAERSRVEALTHLLYSAPAWEVLKDFGGLNGAQAGQAASWALKLILSAVSRSENERGPNPIPRKDQQ